MLWELTYKHKYTLHDIEEMIPYERDIFVSFIYEELKRIADENGK